MIYTLYLEYRNVLNNDNNEKYSKLRRKRHIYSQVHFVELASADKLTVFLQKKSHPLYASPPIKRRRMLMLKQINFYIKL